MTDRIMLTDEQVKRLSAALGEIGKIRDELMESAPANSMRSRITSKLSFAIQEAWKVTDVEFQLDMPGSDD